MNKMNNAIERLGLAVLLAGCVAGGDARPNATSTAPKSTEKPPATAPAVPTVEARPPTKPPETPRATITPSIFEGTGGAVNPEMVQMEEQLWAYIKQDLEPKGIFNAKVVVKETQDPKHMFLYVQYPDKNGQLQTQLAPSWDPDGKPGGYTPQQTGVYAGQRAESFPVNFGNFTDFRVEFMGLKKVPGQADLVPSYDVRRNRTEILAGNFWVKDIPPTVAALPTARATVGPVETRTVVMDEIDSVSGLPKVVFDPKSYDPYKLLKLSDRASSMMYEWICIGLTVGEWKGKFLDYKACLEAIKNKKQPATLHIPSREGTQGRQYDWVTQREVPSSILNRSIVVRIIDGQSVANPEKEYISYVSDQFSTGAAVSYAIEEGRLVLKILVNLSPTLIEQNKQQYLANYFNSHVNNMTRGTLAAYRPGDFGGLAWRSGSTIISFTSHQNTIFSLNN